MIFKLLLLTSFERRLVFSRPGRRRLEPELHPCIGSTNTLHTASPYFRHRFLVLFDWIAWNLCKEGPICSIQGQANRLGESFYLMKLELTKGKFVESKKMARYAPGVSPET